MKNRYKKSIAPTTHSAISHERMPQTWLEINRAALQHNLMQYKSIVAPALFAPVIKSNAYGHGIEAVAMICEESIAVDRICVVSLCEAVRVRELGIKKPIIVLSFLNDELSLIAQHDIIATIYDLDTAHALNSVGQQYDKKIIVHIKIDTGLSRLGVLAAHTLSFVSAVKNMPFLEIEGIFTHFANSESDDATFMHEQCAVFDDVMHQLDQAGIVIPLRHMSCSAAITADAKAHQTLSRAGIGIYGLWPSQENKHITNERHPSFHLKPVLSWKTRVLLVKEIPAGSYVGYDLTYQTTNITRIATLPVGYWDGYNRALSSKGMVMIHNQLAPVVGRIAMNLMMVDVTHVQARVAIGDEVTLLGSYQGITADDMAAACNTINYEVVATINPLLPRLVV